MAGRLGSSWALARRHPVRSIGVVAAFALVAVVALSGSDGQDELSTRDAADTTTTTEEREASTTSTSTSSTITTTTTTVATTTRAAPPPTTTSPPTTAPPPPPTTPPRQLFVVQSSPQGLASLNPDGSGLHLLVEGTFRTPDLAPDRSWLVMTKWTEMGYDLYTVNSDGSDLTMIAGGHWQSARVSPDSTKIAAVQLDAAIGMRLVIMDRSGGGQQVIHLPNGVTNNVDWSPDGTKLVVTGSDSHELSVYDLATRQQTFIRPGGGLAASPVWSPDGSRIAFLDGKDLVVIPAGGGPEQVLTGPFLERPYEVAWDGSRSLLFTAGNRLYRIGRDGSGLVQVGVGMTSPAA